MPKAEMSEEEWEAARADLARAVRDGWAVLGRGGSALDAVEAAVLSMEDSPHFNAGYGSALNAAGEHELDASIMDGANLAAGAVCAVRRIRNPIRAARAVMATNDLLLLAGAAADTFAEGAGLAMVEPSYFTTRRRQEALAAMRAHERAGTVRGASEAEKHGTVGAVALDDRGHLAAATSTGGYTNKPEGRIGDSPIIGAGTYAKDGICAVSCTGKGEFFIRHVIGHEIATRRLHLGESLAVAAGHALDLLRPHDVGVGLVAIDERGNIVAPYDNTPGMYRAWITPQGELSVASHGEVFVSRAEG
jgi:beta-aspartyl-peptidase (threonine type)